MNQGDRKPESPNGPESSVPEGSIESEARRRFLEKCGRFAVVTPPAMTMLLSVAAKPKEAHASTVLGGGWGGGPPKPPFPPRPPLPPIPPRPKFP
jgi:hypothetical protein